MEYEKDPEYVQGSHIGVPKAGLLGPAVYDFCRIQKGVGWVGTVGDQGEGALLQLIDVWWG